MHILNDWRSGVLLFLIWLLFEDLARKYLGNSMTVYFAKDFLIGVAYLSFYAAKRKHQVEVFKIPFLLPLAIFFWFAVIQVFNTWSPSILYGLLGLKMYFYYAPLMLLGYAMMDTSGGPGTLPGDQRGGGNCHCRAGDCPSRVGRAIPDSG